MPLTAQEQKQLSEVLDEIEPYVPTSEDLARMAAEWEETFTEGRRKRPFPQSPHGE